MLFLAYTVAIADRFILSLLIEPIKADLGLTDTKVSLLHGFAFLIFFSVMGVPIARFADRYSRRLIIAIGIAVWSAMTVACGTASNYGQLFAARVGVGVGEAALSPPAYSMVSDLFPPSRLGLALSVYTTGAYVGVGLAFVAGGLLLEAAMQTPEVAIPIFGNVRSWQVAFFLVGMPGLAVAALMFTVREPIRRMQKNAAFTGDPRKKVPLREVSGYMWDRRRVYLSHILGFAFLAVVFNATMAWTPAYLTRSFGLSIGQTGPVLGVLVLFCCSGGIMFGGWLADRLVIRGYSDGAMRVGIVGGFGCVVLAVFIPLASSLWTVIALFGPLLFLSTLGFGAAAAALQQITPNRLRALTSAVYLFMLNLIAFGTGPTITALLTDLVFRDDQAVGLSIATTSIGGGLASASILWFGLKHFREEVHRQSV